MKKRGLAKETIRDVGYKLKQLSKMADLHNPEQIKIVIAEHKVTNATKTKLVNAYGYFADTHQIRWIKPKYRWERKTPIIPTTANIDKIISASTRKYATIFTILKETGLEGHELATTTRKHIDTEQGIISAQGCKGHNSRSLKLKPKTLLRNTTIRQNKGHPISQAKIRTQEDRNNNVLYTTHPIQRRRRRLYLQNRKQR